MMRLRDYDVIVTGGGAAGVAAAIGAARAGARTLLVETYGCLGGAATMKNVLSYCGLYTCNDAARQVVFGVASQVLAGVRDLGGLSPVTRFRGVVVLFDPEMVKVVLDRMCAAAGVEVLLHASVIAAARTGGRIESVTVQDRSGPREIAARAFVDASGDGDLAAFAGAASRYGNGGRINIATLAIRIGGVPAEVPVAPADWSAAISSAKARGVTPLVSETGFISRIPISNDIVALVIDEDYDARSGASIAKAEAHGREQALAYLEALRALPGYERAYLVSSGPVIGTRESRHVEARYQMTRGDVESGARFADAVALGAWPMEFHPSVGAGSTWMPVGGDGTYDIPLRALHSSDTENLFAAGRTIDGDQYAGASLRVMGTAFGTGQAAGIAAAHAASGVKLDAAAVRVELAWQGARLRD